MSQGEPQDEYRDVAENIRHWQNMRFTSMTVFLAAMVGLLAALFQWSAGLPDVARISVIMVGLVVVLVFWVQDERIVKYWTNFVARARVLEKELGYQQYSTTPPRNRVFTSGNAIRFFYLTFSLFWIAALVLHKQF